MPSPAVSVQTVDVCFVRHEGLRGIDCLAVLRFALPASLGEVSEDDVLERLKAGVTSWMKDTEEGRKEWVYSGEDFNVGDLMGHLDMAANTDSALANRLRDAGILSVEVLFQLGDTSEVSYDRVLVNEWELEDADETKTGG